MLNREIEDELINYNLKLYNVKEKITHKNRFEVICQKGHIKETNLKNVRKNKKCVECNRLKPYYDFKESAEKEDYIVVTTIEEYIKTSIPFKLICPKGHACEITKSHFDNNRRCPDCKGERLRNSKRTPLEDIIFLYENEQYTILNGLQNYENERSGLTVMCPNGHEYNSLVCNFKSGYRCDECFRQDYRSENVYNWKGYNDNYITMFRRFINSWRESTKKLSDKCVLSGSDDTEIHHLYSFIDIVEDFCHVNSINLKGNTNEISNEEKYSIRNKFLEFHNDYGLGVCLDKNLHILFHQLYGKKHNTPDQFNEFVNRYKIGDFDKIFDLRG